MGKTSAAFNVIFGAKTGDLTKALRTIDGELTKTSKKFKQVGATMSRNVTAPLALIGATSFKVAADFDASMSQVKAISGATGAEFQRLEADALRLGSATKYSATEVSGLQTEFAKLGFTSGEIIGATEATLALAQASGSDLASAAEVAGATLRGFGINAGDTQRVTDVMASAFSSSALDLGTFQDSMKFVAPVAKAAGVSLEETTAMLGVLANNGIKGSQAGTALRRIMSEMAADGSSFEEAFAKSADSVITLGDAKDEVGRSAQSAFLVLQKGMKDVKDLTGGLEGAEGAAAKMAATMGDNAAGDIARMQSAVEGAQITIGRALAPTITDIIGKIGNAASAFSNMTEGQQKTILGFAGTAAAIGPVSSGIGSLVGGVKKAIPALRAMNKAIIANPYVAAAVAIVAIGAAIYKLTQRTDELAVKQERIDKARTKAREGYAKEAAEVTKLQTLYKLAGDDQERRASIIERLRKIDQQHFKDLDAEKTTYEDLSKKVGVYTSKLREAAIQKAFGEELVNVEADRLIVAEKLIEARDNLALAENRMNNAVKASAGSMKDGMSMSLGATQAYEKALRVVEDLEAEQNGLAMASEELAMKMSRATDAAEDLGEVDDVDIDVSGTLNPEEVDTSNAKASDSVPIPATFDLETTSIGELFDDLSAETLKIESEFSITGNAAERAEALADAYKKAAVEAVVLGDVKLGDEFNRQAEELARMAEQLNAIARAGYEADAILNELGVPPEAGMTTSALLMGLENVNATTATATETTGLYNEVLQNGAQAFGNNLSSAFQAIQQSNEELTKAVEEGAITQEEANTRAAENTAKALKAAAIQTIGSMLAEATAIAIKNAFQTASATGPAAVFVGPALAAGAAAGVAALFASKVPKLAKGGIAVGEQLAVVGDNPSGKEAIIPLERLDSIVGNLATDVASKAFPMADVMRQGARATASASDTALEVQLTGSLKGDDIMLSNERTTRRRKRTRTY